MGSSIERAKTGEQEGAKPQRCPGDPIVLLVDQFPHDYFPSRHFGRDELNAAGISDILSFVRDVAVLPSGVQSGVFRDDPFGVEAIHPEFQARIQTARAHRVLIEQRLAAAMNDRGVAGFYAELNCLLNKVLNDLITKTPNDPQLLIMVPVINAWSQSLQEFNARPQASGPAQARYSLRERLEALFHSLFSPRGLVTTARAVTALGSLMSPAVTQAHGTNGGGEQMLWSPNSPSDLDTTWDSQFASWNYPKLKPPVVTEQDPSIPEAGESPVSPDPLSAELAEWEGVPSVNIAALQAAGVAGDQFYVQEQLVGKDAERIRVTIAQIPPEALPEGNTDPTAEASPEATDSWPEYRANGPFAVVRAIFARDGYEEIGSVQTYNQGVPPFPLITVERVARQETGGFLSKPNDEAGQGEKYGVYQLRFIVDTRQVVRTDPVTGQVYPPPDWLGLFLKGDGYTWRVAQVLGVSALPDGIYSIEVNVTPVNSPAIKTVDIEQAGFMTGGAGQESPSSQMAVYSADLTGGTNVMLPSVGRQEWTPIPDGHSEVFFNSSFDPIADIDAINEFIKFYGLLIPDGLPSENGGEIRNEDGSVIITRRNDGYRVVYKSEIAGRPFTIVLNDGNQLHIAPIGSGDPQYSIFSRVNRPQNAGESATVETADNLPLLVPHPNEPLQVRFLKETLARLIRAADPDGVFEVSLAGVAGIGLTPGTLDLLPGHLRYLYEMLKAGTFGPVALMGLGGVLDIPSNLKMDPISLNRGRELVLGGNAYPIVYGSVDENALQRYLDPTLPDTGLTPGTGVAAYRVPPGNTSIGTALLGAAYFTLVSGRDRIAIVPESTPIVEADSMRIFTGQLRDIISPSQTNDAGLSFLEQTLAGSRNRDLGLLPPAVSNVLAKHPEMVEPYYQMAVQDGRHIAVAAVMMEGLNPQANQIVMTDQEKDDFATGTYTIIAGLRRELHAIQAMTSPGLDPTKKDMIEKMLQQITVLGPILSSMYWQISVDGENQAPRQVPVELDRVYDQFAAETLTIMQDLIQEQVRFSLGDGWSLTRLGSEPWENQDLYHWLVKIAQTYFGQRAASGDSINDAHLQTLMRAIDQYQTAVNTRLIQDTVSGVDAPLIILNRLKDEMDAIGTPHQIAGQYTGDQEAILLHAYERFQTVAVPRVSAFMNSLSASERTTLSRATTDTAFDLALGRLLRNRFLAGPTNTELRGHVAGLLQSGVITMGTLWTVMMETPLAQSGSLSDAHKGVLEAMFVGFTPSVAEAPWNSSASDGGYVDVPIGVTIANAIQIATGMTLEQYINASGLTLAQLEQWYGPATIVVGQHRRISIPPLVADRLLEYLRKLAETGEAYPMNEHERLGSALDAMLNGGYRLHPQEPAGESVRPDNIIPPDEVFPVGALGSGPEIYMSVLPHLGPDNPNWIGDVKDLVEVAARGGQAISQIEREYAAKAQSAAATAQWLDDFMHNRTYIGKNNPSPIPALNGILESSDFYNSAVFEATGAKDRYEGGSLTYSALREYLKSIQEGDLLPNMRNSARRDVAEAQRNLDTISGIKSVSEQYGSMLNDIDALRMQLHGIQAAMEILATSNQVQRLDFLRIRAQDIVKRLSELELAVINVRVAAKQAAIQYVHWELHATLAEKVFMGVAYIINKVRGGQSQQSVQQAQEGATGEPDA